MLDPNFTDCGDELPTTYGDILKEYKTNCNYIKDNFELYPTMELVVMQMRNLNLVRKISNLSYWPFEIIP